MKIDQIISSDHFVKQVDLAEKYHWDSIYRQIAYGGDETIWTPSSYEDLCIEQMLLKEIDSRRPETILEVGCGNSRWLPYLARKRNVKVFGVDYSEEGCALARKRLESANVVGKIICHDILKGDSLEKGQFDLVYSLGLIEHYTDTEEILRKLLDFVKSGGTLLTEIPNLSSIHGVMSKIYQPNLFAKHKIITKNQLRRFYIKVGLEEICSNYMGIFSLNIIAWGLYPRWPNLSIKIVSLINKVNPYFDYILRKIGVYKGIRGFAPFIYATGNKPGPA